MKTYALPALLLATLLLAACGGSDDPVAGLNGTWVVDFDESVTSTLALRGIADMPPEQIEIMKTTIKNALGEDAFIALNTAKKTISAKLMGETLENVPFKVVRTTEKTVTLMYDNKEDTFEMRDDGRLQVVAGGGVLVLKQK